MQRSQWVVVGLAFSLLALLYFGCPTQAPDMVLTAARRSLEMEATSPQALMRAARNELSPMAKASLGGLEEELSSLPEEDDARRIELYEQLAGEWYRAGQPGISGHYAQLIAELRNTDPEAWAMTGTTFSICVQQAREEKEKTFCTQRAIRAYQAAISLAPDVVDHRINLALTHTYNPPADNPMKGILALRELEAQFPENAKVLVTLAELAVKTNQMERAAQRLTQALELDPDLASAHCLLARVQEATGRSEAADRSRQRCAELSGAAD